MKLAEIYNSYMYSYPHKTAYRAVSSIEWETEKLCGAPLGLYFHIPFCETKCGFCNLFSVAGKADDYMSRYLGAIKTEIAQKKLADPRLRWSDLTIGGGTPLFLSEKNLDALFEMARGIAELEKVYVGVETSPNQTTRPKLEILRQNHVDRVSIGVQSFDDAELKAIGRHQRARSAQKALELLREFDFACLNIDLIYGIEGQTRQSLAKNVEQALSFLPDELFIYPIYIREGTGLFGKAAPNPATHEYYFFVSDMLKSRGYHQLSMRRFARKKPESGGSCGFSNMVSLGCGGRSYIGNLHFATPYTSNAAHSRERIDSYIAAECKNGIENGFVLSDDELKRRFIIKNLLHAQGLNTGDYRESFGTDLLGEFPQLVGLLTKKLAVEAGGVIRLSDEGLALSDMIGPMFISPEVAKLMKDWAAG